MTVLQGYTSMLPGLKFEPLNGNAFTSTLATSIGGVLRKKIRALEVSRISRRTCISSTAVGMLRVTYAECSHLQRLGGSRALARLRSLLGSRIDAARCCAGTPAADIDPQPVLLSIDETDRQTDRQTSRWTPCRYIDAYR